VGVPINIDEVHGVANFKVINIMDNCQPYPYLVGLDWAFENQVIINLKKRDLIFEGGGLKVIAPLDPIEEKNICGGHEKGNW